MRTIGQRDLSIVVQHAFCATGSKKKAAAPVAPKKSGWGAPSPASKASAGSKKTMLQLQAEELQTRLTEENLKRLELGKSPARSPLLERLMEQLEAGGH